MAQASATVAYIAAAANRFPYTADISPESLVAFGSHKSVSLWNIPDEKIHATLPAHEGVITCLRFVNESCFVSGDDKGVLRCWKKSGSQVTLTAISFRTFWRRLTRLARPSGLQNKRYKRTRSRYLARPTSTATSSPARQTRL